MVVVAVSLDPAKDLCLPLLAHLLPRQLEIEEETAERPCEHASGPDRKRKHVHPNPGYHGHRGPPSNHSAVKKQSRTSYPNTDYGSSNGLSTLK